MKRRFTKLVLATVLGISALIVPVHGEEPGYADTEYWNNRCTDALYNQSSACDAYRAYLSQQSSDLAAQLKEIEAKKAAYEADIEAFKDEIAAYQQDINTLQGKINTVQAAINDLQTQIDAKQLEIEEKQEEINITQANIDEISRKIKARMANQQSSLRINKYIDILMGAKSLEDFLRILEGMQAITESDDEANKELVALKAQLKKEKAALKKAQDELEDAQKKQKEKKTELVAEQNKLIVAQSAVKMAEEAAEQKAAELEALSDQVSSNINAIKSTLQDVARKIGTTGVTASPGWTPAVFGSWISAGTWNYPGGGKHLGVDYAVTIGMEIHAVGNGVIINSANGCPTYGYLGNKCGYQYGGSVSGGNQVYMLTAVNNNLYAVKYLHMMINTPIATGTVVNAGDVVGRVGSSGNSSGPHCHVEITYLGDASLMSSYLANWSGDLTFGCGWAGSYGGYGRRCQDGYGAPCRIRPETVLGG